MTIKAIIGTSEILWYSDDTALYRLDLKTGSIQIDRSMLRVNCLLLMPNSSQPWCGTGGEGLYYQQNEWKSLTGLPTDIRCFLKSPDEKIIRCGTNRGLWRLVNQMPQDSLQDNDGLPNNCVNCLVCDPQDPETIICGTEAGISTICSGKITPDLSMANFNIKCLVFDQVGMLWCGTDRGLWYKSRDQRWQELNKWNVKSLLARQDGVIWVGTTEGLQRFPSRNPDVLLSPLEDNRGLLSNKIINCLFEGTDRTIWCGADELVAIKDSRVYSRDAYMQLLNNQQAKTVVNLSEAKTVLDPQPQVSPKQQNTPLPKQTPQPNKPVQPTMTAPVNPPTTPRISPAPNPPTTQPKPSQSRERSGSSLLLGSVILTVLIFAAAGIYVAFVPRTSSVPQPEIPTEEVQSPPSEKPIQKSELPAQKSETLTPRSETLTPKSETSIPKSETLTPKPETSTPKSETFTPKPETSTPKSETFTPKPKILIPKSETSTKKLEKSIKKPEASTPIASTPPPVEPELLPPPSPPVIQEAYVQDFGGIRRESYSGDDTLYLFLEGERNRIAKVKLGDLGFFSMTPLDSNPSKYTIDVPVSSLSLTMQKKIKPVFFLCVDNQTCTKQVTPAITISPQ